MLNNADRAAEVQAIKQDVVRSIHCALPGTVLSFNEESCTAEIQLAGDGLPVLKEVMVFMPVPFTVSEGDRCLVVFADRDITRWALGDESAELSPRMHSLSDGFAFVGFGPAASVSS